MDYRNPKASEGQIKCLARKLHTKFGYALGASHSVEDVEQELWIVWTRVVEAYDPEMGKPFAALLTTSARNAIISMARKGLREDCGIAFSLDAPIADSEHTLMDTISDENCRTPEEIVAGRQTYEYTLENVSPLGRCILKTLHDQPEELLEDVRGLMAKADYAASIGQRVQLPRRITLGMLETLFDVSKDMRVRAVKNINRVMEHA